MEERGLQRDSRWQLEIYVREAVYTELRTKFGREWAQVAGRQVAQRAKKPSHGLRGRRGPLADASVLFAPVEEHWELFVPVLLLRVR